MAAILEGITMKEIVETVGELVSALEKIDRNIPLLIDLREGGGYAVEIRDIDDRKGNARRVLGIYANNGGRFGHDPLTEELYEKTKIKFLSDLISKGRKFTTVHGDYRLYHDYRGNSDTCYGETFDSRAIYRMVDEGFLEFYEQSHSIKGVKETEKAIKFVENLS